MKKEILRFCLEKGILLDNDTLEVFDNFDDNSARKIIEKIASLKERVITKSFLTKNVEKLQELIDDKKIIDKLRINFAVEISRERFVGDELEKKEIVRGEEKHGEDLELEHLKVLSSLTGFAKKLEPGDFVKHFRMRYNEMKKLLQDRKELENLSSINKINGRKQGLSIIGIVFDKRVTNNKNILLEVEDFGGRIRILVSKEKGEVYDIAKEILVDDIIGIRGFGNREIIFANDIVYPDIHLSEKTKLKRDERAAFISDIHIGSTNFLEKNFLKFIEWINGKVGDEKQREEAKKTKYLFVTGDSIDGVGIFPGQDELLSIKDIKKQYEKLAEYLSKIRDDVKIIICPGQHDAVRVAEPQPIIDEAYAPELCRMENLTRVTNPCYIDLQEGYNVLMYHGASFHGVAADIESLRMGSPHDKPGLIVKELLKRRHLAPTHSSVVYIPGEKDPLIIRKIPDIITTGEVHRLDVDNYNNVLIIANSCWQAQTPYEEKVGNHPDPCKVPMLNLKTREIKILDFS